MEKIGGALHFVLFTKYYFGNHIIEGWAGWACSILGEMRKACKILVGTLEGRRPLGRPRNRWKGIIKMDFTTCWLGGCRLDSCFQNWVHWWALGFTVINHRIPQKAGNFLTFWVKSNGNSGLYIDCVRACVRVYIYIYIWELRWIILFEIFLDIVTV
jgi:hypothetical protein